MQALPSIAAMTVALILGLGGGKADKGVDPDGVAVFKGDEVKAFSPKDCGEKQEKKQPTLTILCKADWHPMDMPDTGEKPEQVYRLFLWRPSQQPIIVRISTFKDRSASLWVTSFVKDEITMKPRPKAQVADLKPAEYEPILARIDANEFWTLNKSIPGVKVDPRVMSPPDCAGEPVWVLEGKRGDDYRALAAKSCTVGKWFINLNSDILILAHNKVPNF